MNFDWVGDVRKYAPDADTGVIAQIIRYCAVPLHRRGTWRGSWTDLAQTGLVRENYLRQTLGVSGSDAELDRAIAHVRARMAGEFLRNRVTVYYLLAEHFGCLHVFAHGSPPPAASTAAYVDHTHDDDHAYFATSDVAEETAAARTVNLHDYWDDPEEPARSGWGWLWWVLLGLVLLALLLWMVGCQPRLGLGGSAEPGLSNATGTALAGPTDEAAGRKDEGPAAQVTPPPPANPIRPVVVAPPVPAIPANAGVISETRDGKPLTKVYFRSGSAWLVPAFRPAAQMLKAYVADHPGTRLAVSGFADRSGSAATNATMAAERAHRVRAALIAAGIPEGAVELVKPANVVDASHGNAAGRRVEVLAK